MTLTMRANFSGIGVGLGLDPEKVVVTASSGVLSTLNSVPAAQLNAVSNIQGLSGNVQTQINTVQAQVNTVQGQVNTRQSNITATTDLVANSIALASAGNGNVVVVSSGKISTSNVTTNQLHYVSNLTAPVGSILDTQVYSNVGTFYWNKPAGAGLIFVVAVGGGGGGGGGAVVTGTSGFPGSGGGGGGTAVHRWMPAALVADNVTVIVGEGGVGGLSVFRAGAAGNTTGTTGADGGTSRFGGITAEGGGGGFGNVNNQAMGSARANMVVQYGGTGSYGDPVITSYGTNYSDTGYSFGILAGDPNGGTYVQLFIKNFTQYTRETVPIGYGGRGGTANIAGQSSSFFINPVDTKEYLPAGGGQSAGIAYGTTGNNAGAAGANASINWTQVNGGAAGTLASKNGVLGGNGTYAGAGGGAGYTFYLNTTGNCVAGNGGDGGFPGGGGGAGGCAKTSGVTATTASALSGFGGKGGNGTVIVYTYR